MFLRNIVLISIIFFSASILIADTLHDTNVNNKINSEQVVIFDSIGSAVNDSIIQNAGKFTTKYKKLQNLVYEIEDKNEKSYLRKVTQNGKSAAIVVATKKNERILFNGSKGKKYKAILSIFFDKSGKNIGYVARGKNEIFVIVNGTEFGPYVDIQDSIHFSPDGTQFLFQVLKKRSHSFSNSTINFNRPTIILNGKELSFSNTFTTGQGQFTLLSGYPVYLVQEGDMNIVYINGVKGNKYNNFSIFSFSENSDKVAYVGFRNDTAYVVIDSVEIGGYTRVPELIFSPDASEYAYIAYLNYDAYVFKGDEKFGPYDDAFDLTYSENGQHFAYTAKRDSSIFIVYDSVEQPGYLDTGWPMLSSDGTRLAYMAYLAIYLKKDAATGVNRQVAVIDSIQQPEYAFVFPSSFVFTSDNKHVGYLADKDSLRVVAVIDGVEGEEYKNIYEIVFSPTNDSYAYCAEVDDSTWAIVIDGQEKGRYRDVFMPVYSADGKNIAYTVVDDNQRKLVVNGNMFDGYRDLQPLIPKFDSQNKIHLIAEYGRQKIFKLVFEPKEIQQD